jgi:hypothetical protein
MACSYSLNINGEVRQFGENGYQELFEFLLKHRNMIDGGIISDIVLSQDNVVEEMAAKIKSVKTSKTSMYESDVNTIDLESPVTAQGSISVTEYLETTPRQSDNNKTIIQQFDREGWKRQYINSKVEEGSVREDALEEANRTLEQWDLIAEAGKDIHSMVGDFFSNHYSLVDFVDKYRDRYHPDVIRSMYTNLDKVKKEIYTLHGKSSKLIPQLTVDANTVDGKNIIGAIDLVVIDEFGQPHIYLFKSSTSTMASLDKARNVRYNYQLAFYRQILASKGVPTKSMDLNIVPIITEGLREDGSLRGITFGETQNRLDYVTSNGNKPLSWGTGYMSEIANLHIPVGVEENTVYKPIVNEVTEMLEKFFPDSKLRDRRMDLDINSFIKNPEFVIDSPDPSKGRYFFIDKFTKEPIYIKEESDRTQNEELREKVTKYIEKLRKHNKENTDRFMTELERVVSGRQPISKLYSTGGVQVSSFLVTTFSKYTTAPGWSVVKLDNFNELGMIVLQNILTKQIDVISLSYHDLNSPMPLSLGSTILGSHEKDVYIKDPYILKSTGGNIELIKIMAALNQTYSQFEDKFSIGELKVINPDTQKATIASNKLLINAFSLLCNETGVTNNIRNLRFADAIDLLKNEYLATLNGPNLYASGRKGLEGIRDSIYELQPGINHFTVNNLMNIQKTLENSFPDLLKKSTPEQLANRVSETSIERLYMMVLNAIRYCSGLSEVQPEHLAEWSGKGQMFSGYKITNPDLITENNMRQVVQTVRGTWANLTRDVQAQHQKFAEDAVKPLWEAKGFSALRRNAIGNQRSLYSNMIRRNSDGTINSDMLFQNPYDNSTPLTNEEREFLKKALWEINKWRFNLKGKSINSPEVQQYIKQEKWYWIPLQKSDNLLAQSISELGFSKYIQQKYNNYITEFKSNFAISEHDSYTEEELIAKRELMNDYEMHNRFNYSESSSEARRSVLAKYTPEYWEQNIETLVTSYELYAMRKIAFDKILPVLKAVKLKVLTYGNETGVDVENINKAIDAYIKVAVYNESLVSKEGEELYKYVKPIRNLITQFCIAFNAAGGVRDMLSGFYKNLNLVLSGAFQDPNSKITMKDLIAAYKIMSKDIKDYPSIVTKIELINGRFRLAGFDMNKIQKELVSNKSGLANLSQKAYWMSTAPDYFHRMALFIARSLHDGSWDAMEVKDGQLTYDWKKDKRFTHYVNNNTSHPDYNKERALYLSMLREASPDGKIKEGDSLPFAYTEAQITGIKTLSDTVYGHYDYDAKMVAEKVGMGLLFMQFRTYLSSIKNTWALKPDQYNTGAQKHATNEFGELLYWDGDVITTKDTGVPVYEWGSSYMEGILYSLKAVFDSFRQGGIAGVKDTIFNDPTGVRKQNLKKFGNDVLLWILLGTLGKLLIDLWDEKRNESRDPNSMMQAVEDAAFDVFERGFNSSYDDLTPLDAISSILDNSEPAAVGYVTRFFNSTWDFVAGDKSLGSYLSTNISAVRQFREGINTIEDMYEAAASE